MPVPRLSPRHVGVGAAVVTVALWTAFILIARASAARSLTPFDLAFVRILGAAAVLLPWSLLLARREPPGSPRSLLRLSPLPLRPTLVAGALGGVAYAVLAYSGFFFAPAAHASVLMPGSMPLWTTLLAAWLLGDRIGGSRAFGLALIVAGGLLVGGRSLLHAFDGGEIWKGDLLFLSCSACWALFGIVVRRERLEAVRVTIAIIAFACVSYVPAYLLLAGLDLIPSRLLQAPLGEILFQMAFQGVASVVVAGIGFTLMVQAFGPVRTTMITALVPGLSALGAVLLLGEPMSWNLALGLVCVTAGILFGVRAAAPRPAGAAARADAGAAVGAPGR